MFIRLAAVSLSLMSFLLMASQGFQLLGGSWQPALTQKTGSGWQHVYLCQNCRFTPSLTINTSINPEPDDAFQYELERSFEEVYVESVSQDLLHHFSILRAFRALDPVGPEKITVVSTRIPSEKTRYWHHIQAVIEQGPMSEELLLEDQLISLLSNAQLKGTQLIIPGEQSAVIDLTSPDRNWLSDVAEKSGITHKMFENPVTTAGLLIIGVQLTLGLSGVRGPCGKPLHQCPCTKKAMKAANMPCI
ncbi:hypothetical protein M3P05_07060 [Sansalvadorimonas sp. 2012CJ34-2]|uniref:Uncharacterized protein n=1 Tax=Parendozoicomonas callyspongiae TaxID=2942213 RepID=A0ABT0PEA3_9GAMM|nr:hypothetical protein [Sansalvadorimonas sp. 2012CJ34-2]MCL6269697.1 hypothetical protein [Sansalvadorimonas sp. 2012CJ34-2]